MLALGATALLAVVMAACESASGEATTPTPEPSTPPAQSMYRPLDAAECDPLRESIEERLGAGELNRSEQNFTDAASGTSGVACWLWIVGSGEDYGDFVSVAQTIGSVLTEQGWTEDTDLIADAPAALATGYRKGDAIALAVRTNTTIFAEETVLSEASIVIERA
jgi:hypothetical protein